MVHVHGSGHGRMVDASSAVAYCHSHDRPHYVQTDATIFVVDDDSAFRESLRWLLEPLGYAVEAFASAKEFLESYKQGRCGCLVVDLRMPEMTGIELQEELNRRNID